MMLSTQVITFFEACLLGFLLGLFYDAFRILRLSFPNGRVLIFFEDVLFFAVAAVVSFSFILLVNNGVLRAFLLIGELLGGILYFFTLSLLIMKIAHFIIRCVHGFFRFLYKILLRPVIRLFTRLLSCAKKLLYLIGAKYAVISLRFWLKRKSAQIAENSVDNFVCAEFKKHLKQDDEIVYNDTMQSFEKAAPKLQKGRKRICLRKRPKNLSS